LLFRSGRSGRSRKRLMGAHPFGLWRAAVMVLVVVVVQPLENAKVDHSTSREQSASCLVYRQHRPPVVRRLWLSFRAADLTSAEIHARGRRPGPWLSVTRCWHRSGARAECKRPAVIAAGGRGRPWRVPSDQYAIYRCLYTGIDSDHI